MPASLATLDAILQDDYKTYRENLNNKTLLLSEVKTKTDSIRGRRATHSVHLGRSGAIGAANEGDVLPVADTQRYSTVQVPVRTNRSRIQLTVQLIEQAKGDPGSFIDALEGEMNIMNDSMRDVNRQLYGTSNGVIAGTGTSGPSATVQLLATTPLSVMRHLYVGRQIDIGTVAAPFAIAQTRSITAVNIAARTITISGANVSVVSGTHFIFNTFSGGASTNTGLPLDGQRELTGLQTIVSTTAILHTIDPATQPAWQAQVYSNSGTLRPLAETTLDLALLGATAESGATPKMLISNTGVFVSGKAILTGYQRNIDTLTLKGGFQGIKWSTPGVSGVAGGDVGWFADFDCPANMLFGINTDSLVCHQAGEGWQWMQEDGAILSRVSGSLAYEAVAYALQELACTQRNANFLISDLIEAS